MLGRGGRWPFAGHVAGETRAGGVRLSWAGRVSTGDLGTDFLLAKRVSAALGAVVLETLDRRLAVAAGWEAVFELRDELEGVRPVLALLGEDGQGGAVSAAGLGAMWSIHHGCLAEPWVTSPHPLLSEPHLPAAFPGALTIDAVPPYLIAVGADGTAVTHPRGHRAVDLLPQWLRGDLGDVDPRGDLERLRGAVLAAAHRGEDLSAFWRALGERDAVACAELAAGPKAVAHPVSVRGCVAALPFLETVLAPSGLYSRLADLAPDAGTDLLEAAIARHPQAGWLVRLCRRFEEVPGRSLLAATSEASREGVVKLAVEQGLEAALIEWTSSTGSPLPAVAWLRSGDLERAADYAALAIDADPDCPVLAWLAAVVGPDVSELAEAIRGRLSHDAAHEGFRRWTG
jgi:hypothetical protein